MISKKAHPLISRRIAFGLAVSGLALALLAGGVRAAGRPAEAGTDAAPARLVSSMSR